MLSEGIETPIEKLLTVDEAAQYWQVSPAWVRKLLRDGALRGVKIGPKGRQWRIPESELQRITKG